MSDLPTFALTVDQVDRYRFDVRFDDPDWEPVRTDEPAPLGEGSAPNPSRLLAAAVGNCMAASLLFCLEKARVPVEDIRARVTGTLDRNERGRLRIASLHVIVEPTVPGVPPERMRRCLEIFEDFCVVTQSVREGIEIRVAVEPDAVGSKQGTDPSEDALERG